MSTRFPIHVCLVSEQATPNFIPALDSRTRPDEVVLIVSPGMRDRAKWLGEAFRARNIRVSEHAIDAPWDIAGIRESLRQLVIARAGQPLALNVTGGTKPMAIAAQEVFAREKLPILYVHPERNELLPLFGAGERMAIEGRVRLSEYLAIHGYRELSRERTEPPEAHHALCDELVKEVERFGKQLRRLNLLAAGAKDTLQVNLSESSRDERLLEILDKLDRYGLATIEGGTLVFPDKRSRFFANGGWLELYVARVVDSLAQELGIQDSARSLTVESASGARNEIDVAFLARNRMFLIECKARRMDGPDENGPGAETLYKLDSLTAMGGLNTRGMLVSYQPINHYDRQRARQLRIQVVDAGALRNLDSHLRKWVLESASLRA